MRRSRDVPVLVCCLSALVLGTTTACGPAGSGNAGGGGGSQASPAPAVDATPTPPPTPLVLVTSDVRLADGQILMQPAPASFAPTISFDTAKACLKDWHQFTQYADFGGQIYLGLLTSGEGSVDSGTIDPPFVKRPAYVLVARKVRDSKPAVGGYFGPTSSASPPVHALVDVSIVCDARSGRPLFLQTSGNYPL